MIAWGLGIIAVGCESEAIRAGFDRSTAGAPSEEAGASTAGGAGSAGAPGQSEGGADGNGYAGGTSSGGSPAGSTGGAAGEGGARDVPGNAGMSSSGGAATGGTPGVDPPSEGGTSGAPAAEGGAGGSAPEPVFPCNVRAIIENKCQRCHQEPLRNGAPFPLLTWSDTRAEYGVQLVYQAMIRAIETDFMPFTELELDPPVEPLTPSEKRTLLDWLEAGAEPAEAPPACN